MQTSPRFSRVADRYQLTRTGELQSLEPFYSRAAFCVVAQRDKHSGSSAVTLLPASPDSEFGALGFTVSAHYTGGSPPPGRPTHHIAVYLRPGARSDMIERVTAGAVVREALRDPLFSETHLRVTALHIDGPIVTQKVAPSTASDSGPPIVRARPLASQVQSCSGCGRTRMSQPAPAAASTARTRGPGEAISESRNCESPGT